MNSCHDLYNLVELKHLKLVEKENGEFNRFNVIKITITSKMINEFYHPNEYSINAVEMVKSGFPNAVVEFCDVPNILITYNIVRKG